MTYLLDTDVLVDFFKHKQSATELIATLQKNSPLAISALTLAELRTGWTAKQADFFTPRLLALCEVVPVTVEIALRAGQWRGHYRRQGITLGTVDTIIAATAFCAGYTLVTNNRKDFPMPELTFYTTSHKKAA
jgi:predicted nucleic acid-binding protein